MRFMRSLRTAIKTSGRTRYRLSKDARVAESVLSRFMSGETSLAIETAERVAGALGFEIVLRRKRRGRKGG